MSISSIGGATSAALSYTQSAPRPQPPAMTQTAQLLGISSDQLSTDLQSGSTLTSLAGAAGVSSSDLLSSVETDMKADAPDGVSSVSSSQLTQMATDFINGTAPSGSPSGTGATASANLDSLADAVGMDPSELLSQLTSGQDLSQLLGSAGQTGYGSTVADSVSGGVMFDQYA
jgi:hypothetical protein